LTLASWDSAGHSTDRGVEDPQTMPAWTAADAWREPIPAPRYGDALRGRAVIKGVKIGFHRGARNAIQVDHVARRVVLYGEVLSDLRVQQRHLLQIERGLIKRRN